MNTYECGLREGTDPWMELRVVGMPLAPARLVKLGAGLAEEGNLVDYIAVLRQDLLPSLPEEVDGGVASVEEQPLRTSMSILTGAGSFHLSSF